MHNNTLFFILAVFCLHWESGPRRTLIGQRHHEDLRSLQKQISITLDCWTNCRTIPKDSLVKQPVQSPWKVLLPGYPSSHSFPSLTLTALFVCSNKTCHRAFFLFLIFSVIPPSLKKEKGGEWQKSWLWSFLQNQIPNKVRLSLVNVACWSESTDKSNGMGKLHIR